MALTGTTDDRMFKIYNYTKNVKPDNFQQPPYDLNYDILDLHKKRHFSKGELYKVEYYGQYDFFSNIYNDLILTENRAYYRINEMVYKREMEILWYFSDGNIGAIKNHTKFYTKEESLSFGERRRRNCITNLKINAVGLIMAVSGITQLEAEAVGWVFLQEFNNEISVYIEGAQQFLLNALATTTNHPWLDGMLPMLGGASVRQYLYSELWIDYTVNNTYI